MERNLNSTTGRSTREVSLVAREARRLVGLERDYACSGCGNAHRTWARISDCPECGTQLTKAVIRRAALVPAV
jgi:hypothetical protein